MFRRWRKEPKVPHTPAQTLSDAVRDTSEVIHSTSVELSKAQRRLDALEMLLHTVELGNQSQRDSSTSGPEE